MAGSSDQRFLCILSIYYLSQRAKSWWYALVYYSWSICFPWRRETSFFTIVALITRKKNERGRKREDLIKRRNICKPLRLGLRQWFDVASIRLSNCNDRKIRVQTSYYRWKGEQKEETYACVRIRVNERTWVSEKIIRSLRIGNACSCSEMELRCLIKQDIVNCSIANEKRYGRSSAFLESPRTRTTLMAKILLFAFRWSSSILFSHEPAEARLTNASMIFEGRDALIVSMLKCQCCDVILETLTRKKYIPSPRQTRPIYFLPIPIPSWRDPGRTSPSRNQIFLLL